MRRRRRRTTGEFIEEALVVHSGKFTYQRTQFSGVKNKVVVTCPVHGDFEVEAKSHLKGVDCVRCSFADVSRRTGKHSSSLQDFVTRAKEVHGDRYSYEQAEFANYKTKITVTCPLHGGFKICPTNLIWGRQGCKGCKETGFNPAKHGTFYILQAQEVIKVGITNNSPLARAKRVSKSSGLKFTPVLTMDGTGEEVLSIEISVLLWLRANATPISKKFEGYTECFTNISLDDLVKILKPTTKDK